VCTNKDIANYLKAKNSKKTMWPFKDKRKQKKACMILTIIGVALMFSQFNLGVLNLLLSTAQLGLIVATIGVIYVVEASY